MTPNITAVENELEALVDRVGLHGPVVSAQEGVR